jgi:hypothetical protein
MAKSRAGTIRGKNLVCWNRAFEDPIDLPRGRQLVTLQDAGNYISKLPKAEHSAPEWQDAMQILMLVAARGWPTMMARIGVLRALHRHDVREFTDRKETHWGKQKLKRGMSEGRRREPGGRKSGNQYRGFGRLSRVSIDASLGGNIMNSEIARARAISEIDKLGAVRSPSSKPPQTALKCPS